MNDLQIDRLRPQDAGALASFFSEDDAGHYRFFTPFPFDAEGLSRVLSSAKQDLFFAVRIDGEIAAFFMLRGWDAGYAVPAYGVAVRRKNRRQGLSRLCLAYALSLCKANGVGKMMLKCHPENTSAARVYEEAGFVRVGVDARNDNGIFEKDLL